MNGEQLAVIGRAFKVKRTRGIRRTQLRAAKQLCNSFGHSYMQAVSNGLCVCVYCGHSTAPSLATETLARLGL